MKEQDKKYIYESPVVMDIDPVSTVKGQDTYQSQVKPGDEGPGGGGPGAGDFDD